MNKQEFMLRYKNGNINKKELKNFIHENGFFSKAKTNLLRWENIRQRIDSWRLWNVETFSEIPDGDNIYIYDGIISQQYWVGETNWNWYKIDKNAWDFSVYRDNSAILLMHNPDFWVIGNMHKMWVVNEWLRWIFWIDINNISDTWIQNQIKTWTLKASSTGCMMNQYMLEDTNTGINYSEEQAEKEYGEYQVFLAMIWLPDQLIMNITGCSMFETSLVSIWSNHKAVHRDTINNYFTNLLQNKMSKEQIDAMNKKLENNVEESAIPEVVEPTVETVTDPVVDSVEPVVDEVIATVDESDENSEESETVEKEVETPEGDKEKIDLLKEIERLKNEKKELEDKIKLDEETAVLKTNVVLSDKKVQNKLSKDQIELNKAKMIWNA